MVTFELNIQHEGFYKQRYEKVKQDSEGGKQLEQRVRGKARVGVRKIQEARLSVADNPGWQVVDIKVGQGDF